MSDQPLFEGTPEEKLETAWRKVLEELRTSYPKAKYAAFVKVLTHEVREPATLLLKGSEFVVVGCRKHGIQEDIHRRLQAVLDFEPTVVLEVAPRERPAPQPTPVARPIEEYPSHRETFDNYVVGPSNKLAFEAAKAVSQHPGERFNPLFLHGAPGVGKTHLLRATLNEVKRLHPQKNVRYMSAQDFSEEFIEALQAGRISAFRRRMRSIDVLLLDDVQELQGRGKTQEELFYTFNALSNDGKQLVFAGDRPPRELNGVGERMLSRFEGGLVADILLPEIETKIKILELRREAEGGECPWEILEFLATHIPYGTRTLIGTFAKLVAVASLRAEPISLELAHQVVESVVGSAPPASSVPTHSQVLDAVCSYFDVTRKDLLGKSRVQHLVNARHICMFLMSHTCKMSLTAIGGIFNRDHTSVRHAVLKIEKQMRSNLDVHRDVDAIRRNLER